MSQSVAVEFEEALEALEAQASRRVIGNFRRRRDDCGQISTLEDKVCLDTNFRAGELVLYFLMVLFVSVV